MKALKQRWSWVVIVASLALAPHAQIAAVAQDAQIAPNPQGPQAEQAANDDDPPGRVARLNYMNGNVSFQPGGENDWVTAVVNRPLITGDNLWADENSRAEVHIGSTALRLGPETGITLLEVSDRAAQIRLAQGSLIVNVRHVDDEDSYEVDTPNVAFVVTQPGDYRINVSPDGNRTEVTVWRGRGEVTGGGSSYTVVADQHATFTGTDQLSYDLGQIPEGDGFDHWASERDRSEDQSDSANYVSREMTGYDDLDEYGDWSYVADYGMCWRPRVLVAGWAPYRFGHWISVEPWGWTWVADEPWGFAPSHYGRWAYGAGGWFWVPGAVAVRPVYAPALVAWVGAGPGRNFSFSFGAGVGWLPLAPGEVFIPGYRVSRVYLNRVNITNTTVNATRISSVYNTVVVNRNIGINSVIYANRGVSGGVTVVSRETFVNARPVARNVMQVSAKEIAAAPVSHMAAAEPERSSVVGVGTPTRNRPPAAVMNRQVVALRSPAPMPQSFDQRQASSAVRANSETSLRQALVRQEPPGRPVPPSTQVTRQSQDGFRSFDQANTGDATSKPRPRVWEAQGTPEPERPPEVQAERRNETASGSSRPTQQKAQSSQWSHPLAKPVAAVQGRNEQQQHEQQEKYSNWHQQRTTSPAPQRQPTAAASSAPKKGH